MGKKGGWEYTGPGFSALY